jgi:hypothetical protein
MDRLRLAALRSTSAIRTVAVGARQEFERLHRLLGGVAGRLATLGVGFGAIQTLKSSAQLDRTNIQLRQTADMSPAEMMAWRAERWAMARRNGNDPNAIDRGMGQLVAAGLSYREALPASKAADIASTISGADQGELGDYQVTAAAIFGEDLAKPGVSNRLLAQGLVGGRLGRAELPNLPSIFPRVGGSAMQAGLNYPQTIGFIEALSNIESRPDRLATLGESTLRMFTNGQYRAQVTKATGVSFYNKNKSGRSPYEVFQDLRGRYNKITSKQGRDDFMTAVIGQADQDTQRGFRAFMHGHVIEQARDYGAQVSKVTDFDPSQLEENRNTATAAGGRVRATVGEALDKAAQPINQVFAELASHLLDDKGYSGGQLLGGAAALIGGTYAGGRLAKWGGSKAAGKLTSMLGGNVDTLKNIVIGHALQESTGVTPVFVTNWSGAPGTGAAATIAAAAPGAAAAEAAVATRAVAATRAFALMDLLPALAGGEAVRQINNALAPVAQAQDDAINRRGRASRRKAYGMTDDQLNLRDQIQLQEMPYGPWKAANKGKPHGIDDYESWVEQQVRQRMPGGGGGLGPAEFAARLTAPGVIGDIGAWVDGLASTPPGQGNEAARELSNILNALKTLLERPMQIEVTSDTPELHAKVVERQVRDARRG